MARLDRHSFSLKYCSRALPGPYRRPWSHCRNCVCNVRPALMVGHEDRAGDRRHPRLGRRYRIAAAIRSFIFGTVFWKKLRRGRRRAGLQTADFPFGCVTPRYFLASSHEIIEAPRNTTMLLCSLTVKSDDNSVFVRISSITASSVASRTGQRESFPQNIRVTSN